MLQTLVLALGWFVVVNALTSLAAAMVARVVLRLGRPLPPRLLLGLRLSPSAVSLLFVIVMFLPAQWAFEPRDANETLGLAWYGLATAGGWLLARSAGRAWRIAMISRHLRSDGPPRRIDDVDVYEVPGVGGVSLAGVLRSRILVGPGIVESLSPAELSVAVAHEIAHRDAFDNFVRWSFVCAPDLLAGSADARALERSWHRTAEARADARAVGGDRLRAAHLASALIKVARLASERPARQTPAWSTLTDRTLLEWRVRRLVSGLLPGAEPLPAHGWNAATFAISLLVAVPLLAASIHALTETLVALLP